MIEEPPEAAMFRRSREAAAVDERDRIRTIVQTLREIIAEQDVAEANPDDEDGYYLVVEGECVVSVHCHQAEEADSAAWRFMQHGLLTCCDEMVRRGFTTTLFMSPRTLALHVSD